MRTPQPLPKHPDLMTDSEFSAWVQHLVDDQVEEGLVLDYKSEAYDLRSKKSKDKVELAKDVTSFANSQGGVILVGVPEKLDSRGKKTKLPDPNYGIAEEPEYESRVRNILASVVSPMLPSLRVTWVPKAGDSSTGTYLIWHPESWLSPHMVQGYRRYQYFRREADTSRPVPMDEQGVERLYQLRVSAEQRSEDFLEVGSLNLDTPNPNMPRITVCLCPRMVVDDALDLRSRELRQWLAENPFRVALDAEDWRPTTAGAYSYRVLEGGHLRRFVELHSNGALSTAQHLYVGTEDGGHGAGVPFWRIVLLLYGTYSYLAKLYTFLKRPYVVVRSRVWLECLGERKPRSGKAFSLVDPHATAGEGTALHPGPHVIDDTLSVADVLSDIDEAIRRILDGVWRTFQRGWQVPDGAARDALQDRWPKFDQYLSL